MLSEALTDFILKLHVPCRNIPCTALKASASRAGGLVDVIIYVASAEPSICFDRCMYYPAEHMQTDSFLACLKIALRSTGQSLSPV